MCSWDTYVCIQFADGTIETKTLSIFAYEWGLTTRIVCKRYHAGYRNEELLRPSEDDRLSRSDVEKLWRGRWTYCGSQNSFVVGKKCFRDNLRWVYVGKQEEGTDG